MADIQTFTGLTNVRTEGAVATDSLAVSTSASFTALDSSKSLVIISGSTIAFAIRGITAGVDGQRISVINLGTGVMTIAHQATAATAVNRIISLTGSDVASTGAGAGELVYSTSQSRWILINAQA